MTTPTPAPTSSVSLQHSGRLRYWVWVVWPAFLAACLLEALVFSAVDPSDVRWLGANLQASGQAIYTVAFFCFWLVAMACSGVVLWLSKAPRDINDSSRG